MSEALPERIASALLGAIKSSELAALIEEVETAIVNADEAAAEARQRALDPTIADTATARREMEDVGFLSQRLRAALPKLIERLEDVRWAEAHAAWEPQFQDAQTRRDELAMEFAQLYPALATQLVDLFHRIQTCDAEVSRVNGLAPYGEHRRLRGVELHARGLTGFSTDSGPSIAEATKLPRFDRTTVMVWPVPQPIDPAIFALLPIRDARVATGDWWQVKEEEYAAARARDAQESKLQTQGMRHVSTNGADEGARET